MSLRDLDLLAQQMQRESNGLALCVLHLKTFDLGAFTVNRDGVLLVSDQAHGTEGFHEALMSRHGKQVRSPQRQEWKPAPASLDWHSRPIFRTLSNIAMLLR